MDLIQENQNVFLNIRASDPGTNLLAGPKSKKADTLPLTYMAKSVLHSPQKLNIQYNLEGYRDYRGVAVVGAWIWDKTLNLGITTEMDRDETYSRVIQNKKIVQILFIITCILFIITIHLLDRNNRLLKKTIHSKTNDLFLQKRALDIAALVSETDLKGNITYVNDHFCEISQYTREELIGQTHKLINSGTHPKEFWKSCWDCIENGEIFKAEVCNKTKNGDLYWVQTTILPRINSQNQMIGYSAIRINITSKKETERLFQHQSKLASIGEMAASVGHEINNPLAVGVGSIALIQKIMHKDDINNPKIFDKIEKIKDAHERIRNIVDGLRTFARSDDDNKDHISVKDAIGKTVSLVAELYKKDQVNITIEDEEIELFTMGNMGKLQQVIMNLISNAKDATTGQDIREIWISLKEKDQNQLVFSVTDNGSGIPDKIKEKILEPFFTTKGSGVGTGIGLGLVNSFIKEMNGELLIDTELKKGSTFSVILPLSEKTSQAPPRTDIVIKKSRTLEGNVLVVDDEANIREIITEHLESMGLKVDQADDGDTGLEKIKLKKYDYICTDMKMPRMNGQEFIKKAKERPFGESLMDTC